MVIDDNRWSALCEEIKNELYSDIYDKTPNTKYRTEVKEFKISLPKRTLIEIKGFHLMRGFSYLEIIDLTLSSYFKKHMTKEEEISDLIEMSSELDMLFVPTKYVDRIWLKHRRSQLSNLEKKYFDIVNVDNREIMIRWVPNLDKIYAFNSRNDFYLIDYKNIDINIVDTVRKENQVFSIIKISIPYYIHDDIVCVAYYFD